MNEALKKSLSPFVGTESKGVGVEFNSIKEIEREVFVHFQQPYSRRSPQPLEKFLLLKRNWLKETEMLSSSSQISMNMHYQQIIGMGEVALPFIFADLKNETEHWFWALKCITCSDPVPDEYRGDLEKMREHWLKWAQDESYID